MEPLIGAAPISPAWKAGIIADILKRHLIGRPSIIA
jgi:hypothetical protein